MIKIKTLINVSLHQCAPVQSKISGWAFTLPVISRAQLTRCPSWRWGRGHRWWVHWWGRWAPAQGSISMGMIVRMTSSLPRRTTTRKLVSFLMAALTSVAVEMRWPLMEIMTSCSLSPPLQKRQDKRGKEFEEGKKSWLRFLALKRIYITKTETSPV